MSTDGARPVTVDLPPSCDEALANAARILRNAETETDRHLMERYEKLADSWLSLAAIQRERER